MEISKGARGALLGVALLATGLVGATAHAANDKAAKRKAVFDHWTADRRAAAQPRDLVIDHRGLGYLRRADGSLHPHGHIIQADENPTPAPRAKPDGSNNDSEPPVISNLDPDGVTVGASATFSATVTDNVGLRSVTFVIVYPSGNTQNFSPSNTSGDTWSTTLSGFTDGNWSWYVVATDTAKRGGNTTTSPSAMFIVDTSGGGGGGGGGGGADVVTNAEWTAGGAIQTAAGRLFYEMPTNSRLKRWAGYVCSGTVVTDSTSGRSVVLTAAHCVYDDANKAFARNVLFIPNQAGTTGSGTDSNCSNDPLGCYVADFGVVDVDWTTRTFPDNIPWDYAYYVVENVASSHQGNGGGDLDTAAGTMQVSFNAPNADDPANDGLNAPDYTHAMGYSYSDDPNFMYCAQDMTTEGADNWWLPDCGLSGGSSGGPWLQPFSGGTGTVISVNSWGYTTSPGMAGPILNGTSAGCVFEAAKNRSFVGNAADGSEGYAVTCP